MSFKQKLALSISVLISTAFAYAGTPLAELLSSKGWVCTKRAYTSISGTVLCKGKILNYPENIRIYFRTGLQAQDFQSLHLFFHGHRLNSVNTFNDDENSKYKPGDFQTQIFESATNGILIIPESSGKCETYKSFLATKNQFEDFLTRIQSTLGAKSYSLKIAGHSGGGSTINRFLSDNELAKRTKATYLFDSIYGPQYGVLNYLKVNPNANVEVVFVHPGSTMAHTEEFLQTPFVNAARARGLFKLERISSTATKPEEKLQDHMNVLLTVNFINFLK